MDNPNPLSEIAQNFKLGYYRHFKGQDAKVIALARHSEDPNQEFVVYDHDGKFWVRPLKMFLENIQRGDYNGPRFKKIN